MHRIISVTLIFGIIAPILIGSFPVTVQAQLNNPTENTPTGQLANTTECSVATTNGATDVNSLTSVKNNLAEKAAKLTQLSRDLTSLDQQLVILQELNKNIAQGDSGGANGWLWNTDEYNNWVEQRVNLSQKITLQIKNISDSFPEKKGDLGYAYGSTYFPQNPNPVTTLNNDLNDQNEVKNLIDRGERVILTTKDDVATINRSIDSINICNTQTTTPDDQEAITQQQEDAAARASAEEAANNTRAESIANTNSNSAPALPLSECVIWKAGSWLSCFRDAVSALMQIMTWLFSFLVYLAAKVFNTAISYSILDFKDMTDSLFISALWATVRDIANMMIIFFLLYIALATILQLQSVDTAKAFTAIIIVSLLVNFSGVITRVAIDVSNVSALVFYNRFVGTDGQADLSGYFIMNSDLGKLITVDPTRPGGNNDVSSQIFAILVKGFSNAILSCVTAFVLIMAAGFFIVRTATLIFLIILSPLAFIGYAIPFVKTKVSDVWYKELIGQVTFAPVFMGLFYFTIKLTEGVNSLDVRAVDSAAGQVIIYAMLMAMMLGCLKIARNSATGMASSQIKSWGSAGAGFLGGTAAGYIGRNSVGRISSRLARSEGLQTWAANSRFGTRTLNTVNRLGQSSFDVRNNSYLNRAITASGASAMRGGGQGGYNTTITNRQQEVQQQANVFTNREARATYANRVGTSPMARLGSGGGILSVFGRGNRLAAAQLLQARVTELNTELRPLVNELQGLERAEVAAGGPGGLNRAQFARLGELRGIGVAAGNLGPDSAIQAIRTQLIELTNPNPGDPGHDPAFPPGLIVRMGLGRTVRQGF